MRKPVTNQGSLPTYCFKLNENSSFSFANVFFINLVLDNDIYDLLKPIKIHS
jgi:hypothetical protein